MLYRADSNIVMIMPYGEAISFSSYFYIFTFLFSHSYCSLQCNLTHGNKVVLLSKASGKTLYINTTGTVEGNGDEEESGE